MAGSATIVSFEHPLLGNATDELRGHGVDYGMDFILYLQRIGRREVNYKRLQVFFNYQGVECFMYDPGGDFVVFSVEEDQDGDLKITVLFAGRRGRLAVGSGWGWDGHDFQMLRAAVIAPRASVWFTL